MEYLQFILVIVLIYSGVRLLATALIAILLY